MSANESLFIPGEEWLRHNNVITDATHNSIILNIRLQYPFVKNVEYFMDPATMAIEVHVYLGLLDLMFRNTNKIADQILSGISSFLPEYGVVVKIRRI